MHNRKPAKLVSTTSVSLFIALVGCSTDQSHPATGTPSSPVLHEQHALIEMMPEVADAIAVAEHDGTHLNQSINTVQRPSSAVRSAAQVKTRAKVLPRHNVVAGQDSIPHQKPNTEKYQSINTSPVIQVASQSTSTFSIDVDTGAYANVRRMLGSANLPPHDAVRIEELINYFSYDYPVPVSTEMPFSINTELSSTPWNPNTKLLHIGLKGYEVNPEERPAANLVFLIDVSGSMAAPNKLGLLKSSIQMLSNDLTKNDRVSIVVYAGASGVVLEPTAGNNTRKIATALNSLQAGGSTNGEAGIELAYSMAEQSLTDNSINRIILATDGDFNVGLRDIEKLKTLIEQKRQSGIALTTLGFGSGNYNDYLMEQLANVGNGSYAYIDTLNEARKVLSHEITSTLLTIAKDVKIQVEFNPTHVSEYRLLGYVNRQLANEDFANDKVDAGEIGAGHTVTALYEIALTGDGGEWHSPSKYQPANHGLPESTEIAELRLRYKQPDTEKSLLVSQVIQRDSVQQSLSNTSDNFRFSAAVAGFGQLLRNNKYLIDFDYDDVAELARQARGEDRFGYRAEFISLVELANSLKQQHQAGVTGEIINHTDESEG
jgi:Ca-activated chloride channel family protein